MKTMRLIIFLIIFSTLFFSGCHQKDSITTFRENHPIDLVLAFYPSTLRMVNLAKNEDYNQLIKDVEKGRYFKVNKEHVTRQAIDTLARGLLEEGYEEVMTVKGNDNMAVFALEHQPPVMTIIAETEEAYIIVQVEGMIRIAQLPKLLNSFNDESFLNIFSMYEPKKPKKKIESDTANSQPE